MKCHTGPFPKTLDLEKPFAKLKIVSPYEGIVLLEDGIITIINQEEKFTLDLLQLTKKVKNCSIKFLPVVQNYQYIDKYTVISTIEIFPNYETWVCTTTPYRPLATPVATSFRFLDVNIFYLNFEIMSQCHYMRAPQIVGIWGPPDTTPLLISWRQHCPVPTMTGVAERV